MEDATAAGHSATAQTIQQFSLRMGIAVGFCFADGLCRPFRNMKILIFNGGMEVELDEVSCVVLSLGGLRAARRHWLRRKEDKQQQQLTIPIQQSNSQLVE